MVCVIFTVKIILFTWISNLPIYCWTGIWCQRFWSIKIRQHITNYELKTSCNSVSLKFQQIFLFRYLCSWNFMDKMYRTIFSCRGYCAPEYLLHGKTSAKLDIYSLGVIILVLVSGSKEEPNIVIMLRTNVESNL